MSETANGEMTPRDAMAEIEKAVRFEEPLRQRTEGIAAMIMGFVGPGIFLSYAFAAYALPPLGPAAGVVLGFLWAPWVAAGVVTVGTLWRSAAVAVPNLERTKPSWKLVTVLWVAWSFAMWGLVAALAPRVNEPTLYTLGIGAAWTTFGALNLYRNSGRGRRLEVAMGAIMLGGGVALAVVAPGSTDRDYVVATVGGALATGLPPFALGLWQALRG